MREKFDRSKGHVNIGEIGKEKLNSMTPEERKAHLEEMLALLMYTPNVEGAEYADYKPLDVDIKHNTK